MSKPAFDVPRFLALGDSYTIGEGVAPEDAWPAQLVRALRARGTPVADPEIIAQTGWTTSDTDHALTSGAVSGPYAFISVLSGVNNQYRGMILRAYRGQLRRLLLHAGKLTPSPNRVVVISIPDWGVTPFNTRRMPVRVARIIDSYNRIAWEEATAAGARWVDVTDLSRAHPRAVTSDGLHPSPAMYARWVERILPVAEKLLRASSPSRPRKRRT